MKESKKSAWWKSLTAEEQEDPKNVKKLFHRGIFRRRKEDAQMEKALAYAREQIEKFAYTLNSIEQMIMEHPDIFGGMASRQRKRLIGYLITEREGCVEADEIIADEGGEVIKDE